MGREARDQFFGSGFVSAARISQGSRGLFQSIQIADASFVRDGEHQDFAAFFALADGEYAHPRTRSSQSARVGVGLFSAGEFSRSTHDPAEEFLGRWNSCRLRNIRNPWRNEMWVGGCGRDRLD